MEQTIALRVIIQEFYGGFALVAKNKIVPAHWVLLVLITTQFDDAINATAKINRVDRDKNSMLG